MAYFAAYTLHGPIYGVGRTKLETLRDSKRWTDGSQKLELASCSQHTYLEIIKRGGDLAYTVKNGHLELLKG